MNDWKDFTHQTEKTKSVWMKIYITTKANHLEHTSLRIRVGAMSERVKKICGEIMKEMDRMKGVHVNELETKAEEQKSDG